MRNLLTEKLLLNIQHGLDCTVEICKPGYPDNDELIYKGPAGDCLRYIMEYELPCDGESYFSFTTIRDNYCGYNFEEIIYRMGLDPYELESTLGLSEGSPGKPHSEEALVDRLADATLRSYDSHDKGHGAKDKVDVLANS